MMRGPACSTDDIFHRLARMSSALSSGRKRRLEMADCISPSGSPVLGAASGSVATRSASFDHARASRSRTLGDTPCS
eukprot:3890214-Prymnesium_polylepis.1